MLTTIFTIGPDEKIALARLKMLRHGVGALPVVEGNNRLVGILTLRDINFAGSDVGNLFVRDLMTKDNVITGITETPLIEIADMMIETGIQRIPIVGGADKLIGLVTQSTLIKSFRDLLH
jgi:IMP dehydrogenase